MSSCPACFATLTGDVAAWTCTSPKCQRQVDDHATRVAGFEVQNRTVMTYAKPAASKRWDPPSEVPCTSCGDGTGSRVCPFCHYGPLPHDWISATTTCIAMTGARDSGKSVYIAIAVQQLRLLGSRLGLAIDFANEESSANYRRDYEQPLLELREMIPPTTPVSETGSAAQRPIIFSLGLIRGRRHYLVFRDVAGEELDPRSGEVKEHLRFLGNADCVMFMFDPVKVTTITDLLQDLIPEQGTIAGGDPKVVLRNVLRLIGNGRPRLAVVLSKFDTMERLRDVSGTGWAKVMSNVGSAMLRDTSLVGQSYDEHDGALLDQEVRSLLLRLNATDLITSLERPTNGNRLDHRYFAVSMLGEPMRSTRVSTRGIKPFRCLDPVRWALAANGAM